MDQGNQKFTKEELMRTERHIRILRDELRVLERELVELTHLAEMEDAQCPFCRQKIKSNLVDKLIEEKEAEINDVFGELDYLTNLREKLFSRLG